ncbi:MAG: site-2 protease family protein [Patescibacteria group bacterium]
MQGDVLTVVFQVAILVFSVVLHELAHGYAANYYGDPTARLAGRLTMNPISHIDPFGSIILPALMALLPGGIILGWAKPVPYNPYNLKGRFAETVVTGAGIMTNLLLALIFGLVLRFGGASLGEGFTTLAVYIVLINLLLAIFNAIPIPPLDGSKVLSTVLPFQFRSIIDSLERWGLVLLLIFVFFGWQFLYPIIKFLFGLIVGSSIF